MTLADRIVVLEYGRIAQVGTPRDLYERPANLFVAEFIGSPKMNVIPLAEAGITGPGGAVSMGVRPEHVTVAEPAGGTIEATVDVLEYLGADTFLIVDAGAAGRLTVRSDGPTDLRPGARIGLRPSAADTHWFDAEGQALRLDPVGVPEGEPA
jgi:multiple sugar transport system ATP-binding protein